MEVGTAATKAEDEFLAEVDDRVGSARPRQLLQRAA
jgi:hypothetical protein